MRFNGLNIPWKKRQRSYGLASPYNLSMKCFPFGITLSIDAPPPVRTCIKKFTQGKRDDAHGFEHNLVHLRVLPSLHWVTLQLVPAL